MANGQENEETRAYRHIQIQAALLWKGYHCDICGVFATQTHEIVFRSGTLNNAEARRLSFQKELTAILCEPCHSKAHTETMSLQLLKRNILVYGYDAVEYAMGLLQNELKGKIMLVLPKRESINE